VELLESGGTVVQETRLYDADKGETRSMRTKEEANDYRYFPDPDLLPVVLTDEFIEEIRRGLPELPDEKALRFAREYALSAYDAHVLTASRELAAYYEEVAQALPGERKLAANWVMGELAASLNKDGVEIGASPLSAARLAALLTAHRGPDDLGEDRQGSLRGHVDERRGGGCHHRGQGLRQITDTAAIERVIDEVMAAKSRAARRVPLGQGQALRLFRRPGHEGHRRQG
jgi:aspartyl-tRNA(Asn)/glutamyl-tRNA(Gln) amidotransferase subunit B